MFFLSSSPPYCQCRATVSHPQTFQYFSPLAKPHFQSSEVQTALQWITSHQVNHIHCIACCTEVQVFNLAQCAHLSWEKNTAAQWSLECKVQFHSMACASVQGCVQQTLQHCCEEFVAMGCENSTSAIVRYCSSGSSSAAQCLKTEIVHCTMRKRSSLHQGSSTAHSGTLHQSLYLFPYYYCFGVVQTL